MVLGGYGILVVIKYLLITGSLPKIDSKTIPFKNLHLFMYSLGEIMDIGYENIFFLL